MLLRYSRLCPLRYTLRYLTLLVRDQPVCMYVSIYVCVYAFTHYVT